MDAATIQAQLGNGARSFLAGKHQLLIDGKSVDAKSGKKFNTHNFFDPALPFGGYKQSGWGREMGYEAIELYTEVKAVAAAL